LCRLGWGRTRLLPQLPANGEHAYDLRAIAPPFPGEYALLVTLVQEDVAWFEDWELRNAALCMVNIVSAAGPV